MPVNADYTRALDAAVKEYEQAVAERAALDARISQLQQTIGTLNKLCGFVPTVAFGLTEACRMTLRSAHRPMTAIDVRDRLQAIGVNLDRYANALGAVHTVLKRLSEAGEIGPADDDQAVRVAYEHLGPKVIATRMAGAGRAITRAKNPAVQGLCPPKDRPKRPRH